MKLAPILLACAALGAAALPAAAQARGMGADARDVAAHVVVIPEVRGDVDVRIAPGDPRLPPLVPRREGDRIVIDGALRDRIAGCRNQTNPAVRAVNVRGLGWIAYDRLPVITLRVPLHARIGASGAAWGEVGPSDTLDLAHGGCGDWTVAPVRGPFHLAVNGSGDTRARSSGPLDVSINGSGNLDMDRAAGAMNVAIHGSGDIHLGSLDGRLATATAGSGDIRIDGGHAPSIAVQLNGSGGVRFGGDAGSLTASINGSGDVHVAQVSGPVTKAIHGSGEVTVGR